MGHYKGQCPSKDVKGINALQFNKSEELKYEVMFTQCESLPSDIPKSWVLLDSQSTVSVFNNPGMLTNIRKVDTDLKLLTNGGYHTTNMMGDLKHFELV